MFIQSLGQLARKLTILENESCPFSSFEELPAGQTVVDEQQGTVVLTSTGHKAKHLCPPVC